MKKSEIQTVHTKIIHHLDELQELQIQTHTQYKEYIEKNKTNKVFGLDSFYYQSRLFDLELKHLKEQYAFVNNRVYCDYYKLYGMLKTFYKENFKLEPKKRNYIPYKDLEQFKLFDFADSMNLTQDILDMIKKSLDIIHKKEDEVDTPVKRLNIDNYIYNYRYNNELLKTKVELYEKYLHSYHIYHMSFLSNLLDKILLIFRQNTQTVSIGQLENKPVKSDPVNEVIQIVIKDNITKSVEDSVIEGEDVVIIAKEVPVVPEVVEVVIPVMPEVVVPEVVIPEVPAIPEVVIPEVVVPEVVVPEVVVPEVPAIPEVVIPEVVIPEVVVPEVVVPEVIPEVVEVVPVIPEVVVPEVPAIPEVVEVVPEVIPEVVVPEVVIPEVVEVVLPEVVEVPVIPEIIPSVPEVQVVPEKSKSKKGKKSKK